MEDLTLFKWLAVFGALAWLPPIFIAIKNWIIKPKLSIISDKQLEIGYTSYGPIINIDMAFSTERKDTLINKVLLKLVHEKNETHNFIWEWFEETLLEMSIPNTGTIPYKKNQKAFALKVLTSAITEKKIGFQIPDCKSKSLKLILDLNDIKQGITSQGQDVTLLKVQKEYIELLNLCHNSFIWKTGNYKISISVYTYESKQIFNHYISFSLTDFDIKLLEKNISTLKDLIDNRFITQDVNFMEKWNWVYPTKHDIFEI